MAEIFDRKLNCLGNHIPRAKVNQPYPQTSFNLCKLPYTTAAQNIQSKLSGVIIE